MTITKFGLPVLHRVSLTAFSLYTERSKIELEISNGVFCLVGANGIGKTTFIAAVNFGICGRLPKPGERFPSSDEYFQNVRDFSLSFFDGRIAELDRSEAEIEVEFSIKDDRYHIVRGAFEPDQLRYATVNDQVLLGNSTTVNDKYKASVVSSVGVSSFEQFLFLQLFIFTFDEQRNLTFWEAPVQRQMLLLAFGDNAGEAQEAEELRRRIERLDSNARNANYQATETRKKLQSAHRVLDGLSPEIIDLRAEQEQLDRRLDELCDKESGALATLADSKLRSAELRSEALQLREQIDDVFAQRAARISNLNTLPIVADSLASGSCRLCGASDSEVIHGIKLRVSEPTCPLCGIKLPTESLAAEAMQTIVELDEQLTEVNARIQEEVAKQSRFQIEADKLQASIAEQQGRITSFEQENRELSRSIGTTDVKEIEAAIQAFEHIIRELNAKKSEARRERDSTMDRLKEIQSRVSQQYAGAENEFLRIFKNLAESFIGLDLDVRFDIRRTDIALVLAIEGQSRREQHQLSESQRFFVDIALRMAVATFISSEGTGTLLIDTPEGSLDIAYESRAGEMFALFVEDGYNLIMTANINTSQLLLELAKRCGTEEMHLERMTEWTTLSEVQASSQHLFKQAFDQIEKYLKRPAV